MTHEYLGHNAEILHLGKCCKYYVGTEWSSGQYFETFCSHKMLKSFAMMMLIDALRRLIICSESLLWLQSNTVHSY